MQEKLFIDNEWVTVAGGGMFDVVGPSNNQVVHKGCQGRSHRHRRGGQSGPSGL